MTRRILLLLSLLLLLPLGACTWLGLTSDDARKPAELTPVTTTLEVKQLWNTSVGSGDRYFFTPAIVGDQVYVAAADGTVERLSAATGAVVWKIKIDEGLSAGVGAGGGIVSVANHSGVVITLDDKGKELWRASTNGEVISAPAVGNNIVVARTTDSRFLAYDVTTGTRRWFYVRPPQALVLRSAPGVAFARGNIYAGLPGGKLIALAQTNGGIRWETVAAIPKGATELERVADVMGSPALGPRDACVATYQGRIGCYTLDGGTPIWSRDSSTSTGLGIDTRNAYVSDDKSTVQAYSRVAGASLWKNDSMTYRALCAPVAMGEAVVVGDYQGFMSWMSKEDGHFVARMPTDGSAIKMSPVTLESATQPTIIVQTQAGGVYAFATP